MEKNTNPAPISSVEITVPGQPRGKGRPRMTRAGHVYTDGRTRAYETTVRRAAMEAVEHPIPAGTPLVVCITAYLQRPQRLRTGMEELPTTKPDLDNICKAVLDGLNGIAFADDQDIVQLSAFKFYCTDEEEPHVEAVISTI